MKNETFSTELARPTLINGDEIDRYEQAVADVLSGAMDPDRFMAVRLQHGIYGQRQDGVNMVRIKIPGGFLNPRQLTAIADVMEGYSRDPHASVTTRQDIQLHFVPLEHTPAVMRRLGEANLTTREACGNTVRNITACPMAGICPREHTDVSAYVDATMRRFLRHPLTQHMPRKFKMSFSGCEADCAMGMMHDIGVIATTLDGEFGFKVLAGGGLGHKPHEAIVVEEFIRPNELLAVIEALLALHNRHSDRKRRARARIKFLVDRFGEEGFRSRYREELTRTRSMYAQQSVPDVPWRATTSDFVCGGGAPRQVSAQKQPGLFAIPISLPTGDITAAQLRGIASLMSNHDLTDIRATQDQNLMLAGVPEAALQTITDALKLLKLAIPRAGDDVVSCPGTTTCRLGITSSKLVAPKLNGGSRDLRIRVSGCHNSCGQHHIADIGIHGEGNRVHGRLLPSYVMHIGGNGLAGGNIALKGPVIPTMRIEAAVDRVRSQFESESAVENNFTKWARDKGERYFHDLLADLAKVEPGDVAQVNRDHGETEQFQVMQLGGGECAGAAQDFVASHFTEAMHERNYRRAFFLQRKYAESIECAREVLRHVSQSILFVHAVKPSDSVETLHSQMTELHSESGRGLARDLAPLLSDLAAQTESFDETFYGSLCDRIDLWVLRVGQACQEVDRQLDLETSLSSLTVRPAEIEIIPTVDLSHLDCPLHYVKARTELRKLNSGQQIRFVLGEGEPLDKVLNSLKVDGHEIISSEKNANRALLTVRKATA